MVVEGVRVSGIAPLEPEDVWFGLESENWDAGLICLHSHQSGLRRMPSPLKKKRRRKRREEEEPPSHRMAALSFVCLRGGWGRLRGGGLAVDVGPDGGGREGVWGGEWLLLTS